jgi:hypothetical protein
VQIRENEKDFYEWISKQSRHSLFFDGAAKGNPRKVDAGGVTLIGYIIKIYKLKY